MTPEIRARVVEMIGSGHSNRAIRATLGVTLNQVAGVRSRDFGPIMTRGEALQRGVDHWLQVAVATQSDVLAVLREDRTMRNGEIRAALSVRRGEKTVLRALQALIAAGVVSGGFAGYRKRPERPARNAEREAA